jgi:hypothetical protein
LAEAAITGKVARDVALVGKTVLTGKDIFCKVCIEKAYGNEQSWSKNSHGATH